MPKRALVAAAALAAVMPLAIGLGLPEAQAQAMDRQGQQRAATELGTFSIAGRKVFEVAPVGYYTAADRVLENMRRVIRVLEPEDTETVGLEPFNVATDVRAAKEGKDWVVYFKSVDVATVTPADLKGRDMSAQQMAQMWANNLKAGLAALQAEGTSSLRQSLSQMQVAVGGQTIATGITGSTPTMVSYRIRRAIERDPELRQQHIVVEVQPNEVVIRGEVPNRRIERRVETIVGDEAFDRAVRSDLRIEGLPIGP